MCVNSRAALCFQACHRKIRVKSRHALFRSVYKVHKRATWVSMKCCQRKPDIILLLQPTSTWRACVRMWSETCGSAVRCRLESPSAAPGSKTQHLQRRRVKPKAAVVLYILYELNDSCLCCNNAELLYHVKCDETKADILAHTVCWRWCWHSLESHFLWLTVHTLYYCIY